MASHANHSKVLKAKLQAVADTQQDVDIALSRKDIDRRNLLHNMQAYEVPSQRGLAVPTEPKVLSPKEFLLREELRKRSPLMIARLMDIIQNGKNMESIKAIEIGLAYAYGKPEQASISLTASANLSPAELIKTINDRARGRRGGCMEDRPVESDARSGTDADG